MSILQKSNYATAKLTANAGLTVTDIYVTAGSGVDYPQTGTFMAVMWVSTAASPGLDATREIVLATYVSTDRFSVVRAQEGTAEKAWNTGDFFAHVNTAGTLHELEEYVQNGLLGFAGTTGSGNVYTVVMDPVVTNYIPDMSVSIRFTDANSSSATLGLNLLTPKYIYKVLNGVIARVASGDILAGMYSTLFYDDALDGGAGGWMMNNPASSVINPGDIFPSSTSMLFNQTSAPTGWTKQSNWKTPSSILVGDTYSSGGGSINPISWTNTHSVGSLQFSVFNVEDVGRASLYGYNSNGTSTQIFDQYSVFPLTGAQPCGTIQSSSYDKTFYTKSGTGSVASDTYTPRYVTTIICNKV